MPKGSCKELTMPFTTSHERPRLANKEKSDSQNIFKKLSVLEAEKKIFQKQQESALQRVEKIGNRLGEIDHAITELLATLDLSVTREHSATGKSRSAAQTVTKNNHAMKQPESVVNHHLVMRY